MKHLYSIIAMVLFNTVAHAQGTTCNTAISVLPKATCVYQSYQTPANSNEMWFAFVAQTASVNISVVTTKFGINAPHIHQLTLAGGTCSNLTSIADDELPFEDNARELNIDLNASGLIAGQTYFIQLKRKATEPCDKSNCKANNSSDPTVFDLCIENVNVIIPLDFGLEQPAISHAYHQNRGQLIDVNGTPRPDIKLYTVSANPAVYIADTSVSYVFAKTDNDTATPDTMHRVDMLLDGANTHTRVFKTEQIPGLTNYYLAHIPKGITRNKGFSRAVINDVYPNIDMQFYSNSEGVKYYFIVRPGGNPNNIIMKFDGANAVNVTSGGGLQLVTSLGNIEFEPGHAYRINPANNIVPMPWQAKFVALGGNKVKFQIHNYSQNMPLFIQVDRGHKLPLAKSSDDWSTYYGGSGTTGLDVGNATITDALGNFYITGTTGSSNFPTLTGANIQTGGFAGQTDAFIARFDKDGKAAWGTFYGGSDIEKAYSIALNSQGDVYVVGQTRSTNFPLEPPGNTTLNNQIDGFIIRISGNGQTKLFARYFGGNATFDDIINSVAVNLTNNIVYIVGQKGGSGFPLQSKGTAYFQNTSSGNVDAFISAFDNTNTLIWSTYFGGSGEDNFNTVVVKNNGNLLVSGRTSSTTAASSNSANPPCGVPLSSNDFPDCNCSPGCYYQSHGGGIFDPIIVEFNSSFELIWSTYLGGVGFEQPGVIALNPTNNDIFYITFSLNKADNLPILGSGYVQSSTPSSQFFGAFIGKFENKVPTWGSLYGCGIPTNLGPADLVKGIVVDDKSNVYIVGFTPCSSPVQSTDYCKVPPTVGQFPICESNGVFFQKDMSGNPQYGAGSQDGFVAAFNSNNELILSTWYGGNSGDFPNAITYDKVFKRIYITGSTKSTGNFPLLDPQTGNYQQNTNAGGQNNVDAFIARFNLSTINGIAEQKNTENKFYIYPNPSKEIVTIETKEQNDYITRLRLINTIGQTIIDEKVIGANKNNITISISGLVQGIYYFQVSSKSKIEIIKLVITK